MVSPENSPTESPRKTTSGTPAAARRLRVRDSVRDQSDALSSKRNSLPTDFWTSADSVLFSLYRAGMYCS
jgi:hypothetical protein